MTNENRRWFVAILRNRILEMEYLLDLGWEQLPPDTYARAITVKAEMEESVEMLLADPAFAIARA